MIAKQATHRPNLQDCDATSLTVIDPIQLLQPKRAIVGHSAILLPFRSSNDVDWQGFENHVDRTFEAGLIPAVNMDTGYANLIDETIRQEVLNRTKTIANGRSFVAGVFVSDHPGQPLDLQAYRKEIARAVESAAIPIIFQSHGLVDQADDGIVAAYESMVAECDKMLFFELANVFAAFGKIYSLPLYERLMMIPKMIGAKHSSLKRELEWQRLMLRNQHRPDFKVLTGNDLAIDMVMYGSDYLLGLSTFAPQEFAKRDQWWAAGDTRFYELNDLLQYLGTFSFRDPTPAYKHSAAQFLKLRGLIEHDLTHPQSAKRPDSDIAVLTSIATDMEGFMEEAI